MLTICLVKLILILLNYKVKYIFFYNELNYHGIFLGKPQINYMYLTTTKKKNTRLTLYMLNTAYVNSFCLSPSMKWKCRQKSLTRT